MDIIHKQNHIHTLKNKYLINRKTILLLSSNNSLNFNRKVIINKKNIYKNKKQTKNSTIVCTINIF